MIELLALLAAATLLTIAYFTEQKPETEAVCKVWVQEYRSNDWICVEKQK